MEGWHTQYGITGSDIETSRPRSQTYNSLHQGQRDQNNEPTRNPRRPSTLRPSLSRAASIQVLTDPRIPARIVRTATFDADDGGDVFVPGGHGAAVREARYSHRTTDSEWTTDSERGKTPSFEEDPFQSPTSHDGDQQDVMGGSAREAEWKSRMSDYVSNLPNFALGSTTRPYTQKRARLYSDDVSLERSMQDRRNRRGTYSSSDSTFSRLSSCSSSRDSIQHWVDSLDVDDNDNNNVTLIEGHPDEREVLNKTVTSGSSLEYNSSSRVENIPGYGQPLEDVLCNKKGGMGHIGVDDLRLGADASCISKTGSVDGNNKPKTSRVQGPGGRMLQRKLTNSQLIEQAQQHRTLQGRRAQLHHMGSSGVSDAPSDYSIRTASSVAELLLMRNDPEAILLALGFGGSKKSERLNRIPNRFLEVDSRMRGISVPEFLHRMDLEEKGVGFNLNGGLRGLEYVLDRRRTNSLRRQKSTEEEEHEEEVKPDEDMGDTESKETTTPAPSTMAERVPSPPTMEPTEPSLEEIYAQRQPAHTRLYSSADSRDTGSLMSSMDSVMSEYDLGLDRIGHRNSVDHPMFRNDSVFKVAETSDSACRDSSKDSSNVSKEVSKQGSLIVSTSDTSEVANNNLSNVSKEVFHSDTAEPRELDTDSQVDNDITEADRQGTEPEDRGGLTEERINEIREELMLRALVNRARMVIPSPQLDPVDEEIESEPRSPYRIGSLDMSPTTPDAKMSIFNGDKDNPDNTKKSADIIRAYSTSELELHQKSQMLQAKVDQNRNVPDDMANQNDDISSKTDDISSRTPPGHGTTREGNNTLKPVSPSTHKVAPSTAERLLKDNAHGGQESFEIEEISSTENQDDSGSSPNSNKTSDKPSEHGTLSRNPSTQSDSSGFADEGDTPNSTKESSHLVTMVTSEAQTSFDTVRLDSYDQDSISRPGSVDTITADPSRQGSVEAATTPCGARSQTGSVDALSEITEEDIRRIGDRRESFRKSRGTSIVTSKAFSSVAFDDDDAFEAEDAAVCPTDFETERKSGDPRRPHPLRRSGTFPRLPTKSHQGEGTSNTVPEILFTLQESVNKPSQDENEQSALDRQNANSSVVSERRKALLSRIRSVDVVSYPYEENSQFKASQSVPSTTAIVLGEGDRTHPNEIVPEVIEKVENVQQQVCEADTVPSIRDISQCYHGDQSSQRHPVRQSKQQHSTQQTRREPIRQCMSPTLEPWDPSDVDSSYSLEEIQFPRCYSPTASRDTPTVTSRCSPTPDPLDSYSPLRISPPRTMSTKTQTIASKTQNTVLPLPGADYSDKSDSKTPSSDGVWQVADTSHLLEQYRNSEGSPTPHSNCVSELQARFEPCVETVTLRSSFEMDISDGSVADAILSETVEVGCLPRNDNQAQSPDTYQLSEEDKAENWHRVMSSTPKDLLPEKTLGQYKAEDVQVLHTALQRYKDDLAKLEAKSDMAYDHVESDLTEKDRCELDALTQVRGQIMGEIATMESLLAKKKLHVVSSDHKALSVDETELLAASAENLDIIKEMIGLLEEQRSMQHFLQDIDADTNIASHQAATLSHESTDEGAYSHLETNSDLIQEMMAMKSEMEEYRVMAQKELKEAVSELKDSIMSEVRRDFALETCALQQQLKAKDDEIKRLRALLGESEHSRRTPPSNHGDSMEDRTRRRVDELKQLKDLLLIKSGFHDNSNSSSQSEDGKR